MATSTNIGRKSTESTLKKYSKAPQIYKGCLASPKEYDVFTRGLPAAEQTGRVFTLVKPPERYDPTDPRDVPLQKLPLMAPHARFRRRNTDSLISVL